MSREIELWLFWMLIFLKASIFLLVSGQCSDTQKLQLLNIKKELVYGSDSSVKLVKWDQSVDCCSWPGVTCSDSNGQVIELDLSSEFITHGVNDSSSIFGLKYLQKLNLSYNSFNSIQIPARLGELNRTLTHLDLSNAGFVGQIPVEISHLTQLVRLDLSSLVFPGSLSLTLDNPDLQGLVQNFSALQELYLDGVNMSSNSNWCKVLSSFVPDLKTLSLSNCDLRGPLDESLKQFKSSLSVLRLDSNNLSTQVPDFFGNFTNITTLTLASSELFGVFPQSVFQLERLENLDISDNPLLQGNLPDTFAISSLKSLVLQQTSFGGNIPESIGNLTKLSKLDLAQCSFIGTLPRSVSNLTELIYVDLSFNFLDGAVPSFSSVMKLTNLLLGHNQLTGNIGTTNWTNLKALQILDLRNNSLRGAIPESLFSLPSLQKLQLNQNKFGPLSNVVDTKTLSSSQLDTLDLSSNNLQGQFPQFVFGLQGIKILAMSFNNFSGDLDLTMMIQKLKNLSSLDLSFNSLLVKAAATDVSRLNNLQLSTIKLASCKLKNFPFFLRYQSRLSYIDLSENQIQGKIPDWIWNFNALSHLNISHNHLVGFEGPERNLSSSLNVLDLSFNQLQGVLPNFPVSASYLDFSQNNLSGPLQPEIGNSLTATYFFSLKSNFFNGTIPETICKAAYLKALDLSRNKLSGSIPQCLAKMSETLGVLNLSKNNLSGVISDLSTICKLQTLDLSRNSIQGKVPKSLANCKTLEVLDLGNNIINDVFPCWLSELPSLRVLVLRSNHFGGSINCSETTASWPVLQILDMACNGFRGKLNQSSFNSWKGMILKSKEGRWKQNHSDFEVLGLSQIYYQDTVTVTTKGLQIELLKTLLVFNSVDLSNNQLEGEIPSSIGKLTALLALNFSHNSFSGHIPASLGNLKDLESLDLSENNLTGEIPVELTLLTFLAVLNLSHNKLEGMIPQGGQWQTFLADSFVGNEALCGFPLSACKVVTPSGKERAPKSSSRFDWQFILTGIGFGLGSGMVLAPLLFWEKGRRWHDKQVDMLLSKILRWLALDHLSFQEDESDEIDELVESEGDLSEDEMSAAPDEAALIPRFCLYCSKIDITRKKAIHNSKCRCHESPPTSFTSSSSSSSSCT